MYVVDKKNYAGRGTWTKWPFKKMSKNDYSHFITFTVVEQNSTIWAIKRKNKNHGQISS